MTLLYNQLGRAALSKILYIVPSQNLAEEVLQDIFSKLWDTKPKFASIRSAYAWIYKACTNRAIDILRNKNSQWDEWQDALKDGGRASPEDTSENRQLIKQMLSELNDQESQVLIYVHLEGLTQEEIAEVMGVSRRTVVRLVGKVDQKIVKVRDRRAYG